MDTNVEALKQIASIKSNLNNILNVLYETDVTRETFKNDMLQLNGHLNDLLTDCEEVNHFALKFSPEDQLNDILERKQKVTENPSLALLEAIKYCEKKLNDFLEQYKIGFIKSFCLEADGNFAIEIGCLITKRL